MHHCPFCNQAFGPQPGVPAGAYDPFTADVRCPECAQVVPVGTRVLVGATRVEAVGHVGPGRRVLMVLLPALPVLLLTRGSIQSLLSQLTSPGTWGTGTVVKVILGLLMLWWLCTVVWRSWRRWGRGEGEDARPEVAWELQWIVSAGRLEVLDRSKPARVANPLATGPSANSTVIEAARVRAIRAEVPNRKIRGADGSPRSGVQLVLELWKSGWWGARSGLESLKVCVDAGRSDDTPGLDPTQAAQADGDRLANAVFALLTGEPAGATEGSISLRGHTHAVSPWPVARARWEWGLILFAIPASVVVFATLLLELSDHMQGARLVGAAVAALFAWIVLLFGSFRMLTRPVLRRELARCAWKVGPEGVRVTESRQRSLRAEAEGFARLVAAGDVADVQCVEAKGRPRIRLLDRAGRELAAITPDTLPADGREATLALLCTALGLARVGT